MSNKTTLLLSICVIIIFAVIGVGFGISTLQEQPKKEPVVATEASLPSKETLRAQLASEQPLIDAALTTAFPNITALYTVERGALYHRGEWYGAILQYKGSDSLNRDTLRIVLQKKASHWQLRTSPPQPLVNKHDLPDAPLEMLDDINRPAPLAGTATSPAITPNE